MNIRAEISEKEMKETIVKINKTKSWFREKIKLTSLQSDSSRKKKKTVRNTNTWRLNDTFLNNQQVTGEVKREIKKFLETNDNESMTTQKQF